MAVRWQSKKRLPLPRGAASDLLCFGDLVDLGNQPQEPSLNFLVGQLLDSLLLRDLQLLLGVDVALVGVTDCVLEQELRALGRAAILIEPFRSIGLDPLKGIVDCQLVSSRKRRNCGGGCNPAGAEARNCRG